LRWGERAQHRHLRSSSDDEESLASPIAAAHLLLHVTRRFESDPCHRDVSWSPAMRSSLRVRGTAPTTGSRAPTVQHEGSLTKAMTWFMATATGLPSDPGGSANSNETSQSHSSGCRPTRLDHDIAHSDFDLQRLVRHRTVARAEASRSSLQPVHRGLRAHVRPWNANRLAPVQFPDLSQPRHRGRPRAGRGPSVHRQGAFSICSPVGWGGGSRCHEPVSHRFRLILGDRQS